MSDKVKFDPGIGNLVIDFNNFINDVYSQLMSFRTIHQKRARFKLYSNKIITNMKNNIAFYLGCLLWAYHIKNVNTDSPKEIEGNIFLNLTEEEKNNYDYMIQVNFMENYFDSYERDFLYYTGQETKIPEEWKSILALYIEFLERNKGLKGIIGNIYQSFDGKDLYPTIEEKCSNLLYLVIKNHVFIDGNKRIGATLFIYFLNYYDLLYKDNRQVIDNNTLVAITILIAQSNPKEKEVIIDLLMNFLIKD